MLSTPNPSLPGDFGLPIVGDFPKFYNDLGNLLDSKAEKYGNVFRWKPMNKGVCLLGAEANSLVLKDPDKIFSAKEGWFDRIGEVFKNGTLVKDGKDHMRLRKLLQPAFRKSALDRYVDDGLPVIEKTVKTWKNKHPFEVYSECKSLTLDLALKTFYGTQSTNELEKLNKAVTYLVNGSLAIVKKRIPGTTYNQAMNSREYLCNFMQELINVRRKSPTSDLIGELCQAKDDEGRSLEDEEIIDQMIFILMAAHDTTASTLTSMFYELGRQPEWQERLREQSRDLEAMNLKPHELTPKLDEHLMAVRETLRLNAPLQVIPRVNTRPFTHLGFSIESGTMIAICPSYTHRMTEYWEEPWKFDPLRFSPENRKKQTPYSYIPFGLGAHTCLGQVFAERFTTTALHKILINYWWSTPDSVEFQNVPIRKPKKDLLIELNSF